MRIRLEQLDDSLSKKLLPVYFISGEEPLLIQEACDAIRLKAREHGFSERQIFTVDRQFDWQSLQDEANALSLFAEKKLIELRMPNGKPGTPGSKALTEYCKQLPDDIVLLIQSGKLDGSAMKSKWVNTLDEAGLVLQVWPVSLQEMPRWIERRARAIGLNLQSDAVALLADRLEGNLLAAQQELQKLKLLHGTTKIGAEEVLASVGDSARYDVFDLTDACLAGKAKQACKILHHMQWEGTEPTIILWALTKECRVLQDMKVALRSGVRIGDYFKQQRVIKKRQAPLQAAEQRLAYASLQQLLELGKEVDDAVKGAKLASPWLLLEQLCLGLCGVQQWQLLVSQEV
ncbi:MAG: DNA polymerase III subunit delta [Oleiphilaceae bacterium]|nr:DNA polymerase III subunit delta [Oleiphilaceae bacterium]